MSMDLYTQNISLTQKAKFWTNYISALKGKCCSSIAPASPLLPRPGDSLRCRGGREPSLVSLRLGDRPGRGPGPEEGDREDWGPDVVQEETRHTPDPRDSSGSRPVKTNIRQQRNVYLTKYFTGSSTEDLPTTPFILRFTELSKPGLPGFLKKNLQYYQASSIDTEEFQNMRRTNDKTDSD